MSQSTIRLHQVEPGRGLPADGLERVRRQRLHLFPGRALGEDEFDRLQAWADARMAALEGALPEPGILAGLECRHESVDGAELIRVEPGLGLGGERELYSLNHALSRDWESLRAAYRALPDTPDEELNGLYLVLLEAEFLHLDVDPDQAPCRRDELDRLRDARIARGLRLGLAGVPADYWDPAEVQSSPLRAANRFLGRLLADFDGLPPHRGISVALAGVQDNALLWLDAAAGAFAAVEHPLHERLRGHLHQSFSELLRQSALSGDTPLQALRSFAPAYLPAAAQLPPFLLTNPAGVNPLPRLDWFPQAAAQELQVLPRSSLPVIMGANLARAATPFDQLAGDRYRIGLVLADADYRDGLLELPRLDPELPDLLRRQGILARNAAAELQAAWDALAAGFDAEAHPEVPLPERPRAAEDPLQVLADLGGLPWQAKMANAELEAPYSKNWPAPSIDLPAADEVSGETPADAPDGLLARAAAEQDKQARLDELLEDIDNLLEALEEEKKQQRGVVDAMAIDLAQLAGGVAGDGSGLRLAAMARTMDMSLKEGE